MIRIVLVGAAGQMGQALQRAIDAADDLEVVGRVEKRDRWPVRSPEGWGETPEPFTAPGVVVVEFSSPEAARSCASICAKKGAALVSGTTGLPAEYEGEIRQAGRTVPILRASNFSLGVAALRRAVQAALEVVPESWDVEIVERHHRRKKDSPSGTAATLASEIAGRRGYPAESLRYGRQGAAGPRPAREIGVHAVRGGSWVGDHAVLLAGEGEWLELRHVAQDRAAFAEGALAAARFVAAAKPGLYTLDDLFSSRGRTP